MTSPKFRIQYTLSRSTDGETFTEVGFGASSDSSTIADAIYAVQSDIQNQNWETTAGMPEPSTLETEKP